MDLRYTQTITPNGIRSWQAARYWICQDLWELPNGRRTGSEADGKTVSNIFKDV